MEIGKVYGKLMDAYKMIPRMEQMDMINNLYATFAKGGLSMLESPTGTGKTLAYLLASCHYCVTANNGPDKKRVVIATAQKYLQKQILDEFDRFFKNCPIKSIQKKYSPVKIMPFKGKANYLSRKRVHREMAVNSDNKPLIAMLESLLDAAEKTPMHADVTMLDEAVAAELDSKYDVDVNDLCIINEDSEPEHLYFFQKAKEAAADADIVITNHHAFLTNAAYGTQPFSKDTVIIDEAHDLEESALSIGQEKIAYNTVKNILRSLAHMLENERLNGNKGKKGVTQQIIDAVRLNADKIQHDIAGISEIAKQDDRGHILLKGKNHNSSDRLNISAIKSIKNLIASIESTENALRTIQNDYAILSLKSDLRHCSSRLRKIDQKLTTDDDGNGACYMVCFSDVEKYPSVAMMNTNIFPMMFKIWSGYKSVAVTSGTLMDSDGNYKRFLRKIALNSWVKQKGYVACKSYQGYSYKNGVTALVHKDIPAFGGITGGIEKNRKVLTEYVNGYLDTVLSILETAEDGVLILTPSHMETDILNNALEKSNIRKPLLPYAPWRGKNMNQLKKELEDTGGVLISASAWRGMDVKDNALKDIIITRVPFKSPTDPITVAKIEGKIQDKKESFFDGLEATYKKFVQGCGRLCRKEDARGNIHLLDNRVYQNQHYEIFPNYLKKKYTYKEIRKPKRKPCRKEVCEE